MKENPILFSTEMVSAILGGRKTQTRRIIKPQPPTTECTFIGANVEVRTGKVGYYWSDGTSGNMQGFWPGLDKDLFCPYGQPGDRLWVRETFSIFLEEDAKAEGVKLHKEGRHYLDYIAEAYNTTQFIYRLISAKQSFKTLWELVNERKKNFIDRHGICWTDNPWVWVVKFKVLSTTGKPSFDSAQDDKQPVTSNQQPV